MEGWIDHYGNPKKILILKAQCSSSVALHAFGLLVFDHNIRENTCMAIVSCPLGCLIKNKQFIRIKSKLFLKYKER